MFEGVRIGIEDRCHRRSQSGRHPAAPRRVDLESIVRLKVSVPPDTFTYPQLPQTPRPMENHVASCSNYTVRWYIYDIFKNSGERDRLRGVNETAGVL